MKDQHLATALLPLGGITVWHLKKYAEKRVYGLKSKWRCLSG